MARILVVDDEPSIVKYVARVLRSCGHEVIETTNPYEASEWLHKAEWDLLLTDLEMPNLTGLELTMLAREHNIPVAIMTGSGIPSKDLQDVPVISKPFELNEFKNFFNFHFPIAC